MKIEKRNLGVGLATLCGAAALTGVAMAGNPHGTPPGQAHAKGSASASASTAAGVKASAVTNASGHNTNAVASSNRTKLYGNGQTAGQIAMKNGAGASANLYGPGNSQPHKTVCPGGKATFDVHALKAHGGAAACGGTSGGTSGGGSTSTGTSGSVSTATGTSGQVAGATASGTKAGNSGSAGNNSGVLGATHGPSGSVNGAARPAKPVFGAANFTG